VVLEALLAEAARRGVELRAGERVLELGRAGGGLRLRTTSGSHEALTVVLATGGLSLPKTGSDGFGLELARRLGHTVVPTTPALAPLVLEGAFHAPLSGISVEAELVVRVNGRALDRRRGSLLWTHFGVSGPVALDVSRSWLRARLEGCAAVIEANLLSGRDDGWLEQELLAIARTAPRTTVAGALARLMPQALAAAVASEAGCAQTALGQLAREKRREVVRGATGRLLPVADSRGYSFAEATAGGVPLAELDLRTMKSRIVPGLVLVGEMLDVDGRIGGFNFQWAWSSAWVAGSGLASA
jgi:predicted Rossmann fold flavoprotein